VIETPYYDVVAIGTWLYDDQVAREIEVLARPAKWASSRWVEDDRGELVLDEDAPIPETADGQVYYVGTTGGGVFPTADAAMGWADEQSWVLFAGRGCNSREGRSSDGERLMAGMGRKRP
jgi:hypothetical protein